MPQASSLQAEISKKFRIEPELVESGSGIFDVAIDGEVVFSKHAENRFPENAEIVNLISARPV